MKQASYIEGAIVSNEIFGRKISFFVTDKNDVIQRWHADGRFYEEEELAIISEFFPRGGVFVDVGANVGNHTIFVAKYLYPKDIILFEPNPQTVPLLMFNISLNDLREVVDLSHLGVGLSDTEGKAQTWAPPGNLGATRLRASNGADGLPLIRGDDVLMGRQIDFIKIDVEGMEMKILSGLCGTIARWRPSMFIEVENVNVEAFIEWANSYAYQVLRKYRRYKANENYIVVPVEACGSPLQR